MELVYLWVEKYKNIEKQGFNFSPKFKCEYDEKRNELTIDENKDYLNIFPENINITAIVGENRSGKSNILDLIIELDNWGRINDSFFFITSDEKIYTVNFDKDINCDLHKESIDRQSAERISNKHLSTMVFLTLSPFINQLDRLYSSSVNVMSIFEKENYNNNFKFNHFFLNLIPKIPTILNDKFVRNLFKIKVKPNYLIFKINKYVQGIFKEEITSLFEQASQKNETDKSYLYQIEIDNNSLLKEVFDLFKKIEEKKENNYKKIKEIEQLKIPNKIPNMKGNKIYDRFNAATDMKQNKLKQEKEALEKEIKDIGTMKFYFAKDKESHNSFFFSAGELVVLYYIEKLQQLNLEKNDLILLLDECELFLHPEWQKKLICYLTKLFKESKFKRQIILTSHSPFILSDLPKENVIFLENGEQKYPFKDKQTFGANIHTLLSHGFFMKDGLMGEFSKSKISKILKFLSGENKFIDLEVNFLPPLKIQDSFFEKNLKPIIEFIGEDFLKEKLLKMYEIKFPKSNEAKIRELENEIKRLKNASN